MSGNRPASTNRGDRPLRRRQAASLALEGHGRHAAAVGDAPCLHRGTAWRATWLPVKRIEGHAFRRHPVEAWSRHAAAFATAIGATVAVTEVIRQDQNDIGLLGLLLYDRRADHRERD